MMGRLTLFYVAWLFDDVRSLLMVSLFIIRCGWLTWEINICIMDLVDAQTLSLCEMHFNEFVYRFKLSIHGIYVPLYFSIISVFLAIFFCVVGLMVSSV